MSGRDTVPEFCSQQAKDLVGDGGKTLERRIEEEESCQEGG